MQHGASHLVHSVDADRSMSFSPVLVVHAEKSGRSCAPWTAWMYTMDRPRDRVRSFSQLSGLTRLGWAKPKTTLEVSRTISRIHWMLDLIRTRPHVNGLGNRSLRMRNEVPSWCTLTSCDGRLQKPVTELWSEGYSGFTALDGLRKGISLFPDHCGDNRAKLSALEH